MGNEFKDFEMETPSLTLGKEKRRQNLWKPWKIRSSSESLWHKPADIKSETEQKLKYEIAQELGILDKVLESGWKSLSAKETGRIGGLLASKRKEEKDM